MQNKNWRDEIAINENKSLEEGAIASPETLAEKLDKNSLADPQKGFGDVRDVAIKPLNKDVENGIIKEGIDLQLFAYEDPGKRIGRYIKNQRAWTEGKDKRYRHYTPEAVKNSLKYFKKELLDGVKAADGKEIKITQKDFYHLIVDPVLLRNPNIIKEVIETASVKIEVERMGQAREIYYSFKTPGYAVIDKTCLTAHFLSNSKSVERHIKSNIKKGGKITWEDR